MEPQVQPCDYHISQIGAANNLVEGWMRAMFVCARSFNSRAMKRNRTRDPPAVGTPRDPLRALPRRIRSAPIRLIRVLKRLISGGIKWPRFVCAGKLSDASIVPW